MIMFHVNLQGCIGEEKLSGYIGIIIDHYDWVVATQIFLEFSSLLEEDFQFDSYFSKGLKPPTSYEDLY